MMKRGKLFFPLITSLVLAGLYSNVLGADQICTMKLTACPEDYNGKAIYVPRNVTTVSSDFKVCMPSLPDENIDEEYEAPSIMFIIDNSTSMIGNSSTNDAPRDSGGVRFKVVSALLDTIYKQFPDADIGLTVFRNYLYLDARDNSNFAVFPDEYYTRYSLDERNEVYKNQAYIPLLRLDSTLQNGEKAINLLKKMLLTEKTTVTRSFGLNEVSFETTVMQYEPGFTSTSGTNINVAFDAATYAMKNAKNGPDGQFVIFLSDGEPSRDNWPRTADDFENGEEMPTTFTVFFTDPSDPEVPGSIETMTNNIKNSEYSKTNHLSANYSMNVTYDTLMSVLMSQALKPIIASLKKEPSSLKLNNKTYSNYNITDSTFTIDPIILKDSTTHVEMEIQYQVKVADSTTVLRDTTVKSVFDIIRTDARDVSPNVALNCRDTIYYNVSITAPDKDAAEAGPDNGTFQITRTNSGLGDLTVYYTVQGTASKGTDYSSDKLYDSIVFVPGVSSETISITPIPDAVEEGDETVVIKLLAQKNGRNIRYAISGSDTAVVVIKDLFHVSIAATDKDAAEQGPDNGTFRIIRNNPELGDLTVYYTFQGTAAKGTDYQIDKPYDSIKFAQGVSSETILVKPVTDPEQEGDETVVLKLRTQKDNRIIKYRINGSDSAVVVIKDLVILEDTIDITVLLNPVSRNVPIMQQLDSLPESFKKSVTYQRLTNLPNFDGNTSGTILAVKTTGHKEGPVTGKAIMYDALGNVVKKLEVGEIDRRNGDYGAFWDGTNLNNRKVGGGVYLMRVYIDGEKMKSIKVGVRE
ncbi:MAG: hypothetical protein GX639_15450 [Fibrobacter sp.]|nr:hypothetical protein [Fibrobacter sp.]